MTDCMFFDEERPAQGSPQWATITQVSDLLGVPRTTVRGTVRRAATSGESWVRKAMAEDGTFHYLIDPTHESYLAHEQRWKQHQDTRVEEATAAPTDHSRTRKLPVAPFHHEDDAVPPFPPISPFSQFSWLHASSDGDVLHHWPTFRQRLHAWGIQIFHNMLAEEGQENPWQWRWGELHGEGYPSSELAILAALESQLMVHDMPQEALSASPASQATTSSFPVSAQAKTQGFTLFGRRNSSTHG